MSDKKIDVIGFGSPILDLLVEAQDYFLEELKLEKGQMVLTDEQRASEILEQLANHDIVECAGGSCANTVYGVAYLGGKSAFCGVIGDDLHGKTYEIDFEHENVSNKLVKTSGKSGHAITFVTPDGERSFAVHLGAAIHFKDHHVIEEDISESKVLHLEAYQIEGDDGYNAVLKACKFAKEHDVKVSLDLSDCGLINRQRERLSFLVSEYVDIVFANEEEAKEFTGKSDKEALNDLASMCEIAVVKLGDRGSLIKSCDEVFEISAKSVNCLDTTGAGDMYAAGFLFGITNGKTLKEAGEIGSEYATRVVTQIGARLKE